MSTRNLRKDVHSTAGEKQSPYMYALSPHNVQDMYPEHFSMRALFVALGTIVRVRAADTPAVLFVRLPRSVDDV